MPPLEYFFKAMYLVQEKTDWAAGREEELTSPPVEQKKKRTSMGDEDAEGKVSFKTVCG